MNGYSPKDISISKGYGASLTAEPISRDTAVYASGSIRIRVDIKSSGVTVGGGITASLQTKAAGVWTSLASANSSVSITADGVSTIRLFIERAADQVDLPLGDQVRVVMTTGAGSSITIDRIDILQGL